MGLKEMMHTQSGSVVISIILGLGLAALFRKACKDNKCIVIKGPSINDTQNYVYKMNGTCYKYDVSHIDCDNADKTNASE